MRDRYGIVRRGRRFIVRNRNFIIIAYLILVLETFYHVNKFNVTRPRQSLDTPFQSRCQEPDVSAPRENAVVVMLARNKDRKGAMTAIRSFEKYFNHWFHYPIVFLNDSPWDDDFIQDLTELASGNVSFETIDPTMWQYPSWIDQKKAKGARRTFGVSKLPWTEGEGYHHMCRFNSGEFYDHPALKPYKWYWRIEPDAFFTCAITYDPFVAMAKNGKKYGFSIALWEVGSTSPSLFRTVSDYKERKQIPTNTIWRSMLDASFAPLPLRPLLGRILPSRTLSGDPWNYCHFWSNFEIADLSFFRSDEYRDFFSMLDEAGGFYYERWGDAPVHSFGAALFLKPEELHYFADIGYSHPPFQHCPGNAKNGQMPGSAFLEGIPGPESDSVGDGQWHPRPGQLWQDEREDGLGCRCECDKEIGAAPDQCLKTLMYGLRAEDGPKPKLGGSGGIL